MHKTADLTILSKALIKIGKQKSSGRFSQNVGQSLAGICEQRILAWITTQQEMTDATMFL